MFDPTVGQWLEEDPLGFGAGDANLRRYTANDPANAVDLTGEFIAFSNKKEAEAFVEELKKLGARFPEVVAGKQDTLVVTDSRDTEAVFKYADQKFEKIFDKEFRRANPDQWIALAKRRNTFLISAGVFGATAQMWSDSMGDDFDANQADLAVLRGKIKTLNDKPSVHLDIGGEGRNKDAININIQPFDTWENVKKPIPRLYIRTEKDGRIELEDRSVSRITMQATPISSATASEIARLILPGGVILLENPSDKENRLQHKLVIDAIGENGTVTQEIIDSGGVQVLRTTIKINK